MGESAASPFPAPKTQELSLLARKIQALDNQYLREELGKNPRLLALGTDVPTILQEGFRYNALHVAARYGNAEATQIILSTVNGPTYMKTMYPDDPQYIREQRTRYLTDMYLNSPDKGFLETPLHFASKFGWYEVVKILIGHPLCDLNLKNKENKTAQEVICNRATGKNISERKKIENAFTHTKIIPIWRDMTNDSAPIVGPPVNPKYLAQYTPKPFRELYGDVSTELFGPVDLSCIPKAILGSNRDIRAYAGPADEETASHLYSAMKGSTSGFGNGTAPARSSGRSDLDRPGTPPSVFRKPVSGTPVQAVVGAPHTPEQKLKVGGELCTPPPTTPKCPLTANLLSPTKFQYTPQTLSLLLSSPSPSVISTPHLIEDRRLRLKDPEKGVERVGRKYASEMGVAWNEYWVFLGEFVDLTSETGLVLLEDHLARIRENMDRQNLNLNFSPPDATPVTAICRAMQKLDLGSEVSKEKLDFSVDWRNRLNEIANAQLRMDTGEDGADNFNGLKTAGALVLPSTTYAQNDLKSKPPIVAIRKLFPDEDDEDDKEVFHMTLPYGREDSGSEDDKSHDWRTPYDSFSSNSSSKSDSPMALSESDPDSDSEDTEDAECFLDCITESIYIHGIHPSKEDYHAMRALEPVIEGLPAPNFPEILAWFNCLKAAGVKK